MSNDSCVRQERRIPVQLTRAAPEQLAGGLRQPVQVWVVPLTGGSYQPP
jgi:hypothetical protein